MRKLILTAFIASIITLTGCVAPKPTYKAPDMKANYTDIPLGGITDVDHAFSQLQAWLAIQNFQIDLSLIESGLLQFSTNMRNLDLAGYYDCGNIDETPRIYPSKYSHDYKIFSTDVQFTVFFNRENRTVTLSTNPGISFLECRSWHRLEKIILEKAGVAVVPEPAPSTNGGN